MIKLFLQPGASVDTANAQVTAVSQFELRQLPPGTLPPEIINFSASSVPILQLGVSGKGLDEQQLADLSQNAVRPQLVTVPGAVLPLPYGGKSPQISVNMDQNLMQSKGVSPGDLLAALNAQNVVLPSGTAKVGPARIRRPHQLRAAHHRGIGHAADQEGQRRHCLCSRRGHGQQRVTHSRPTSCARTVTGA